MMKTMMVMMMMMMMMMMTSGGVVDALSHTQTGFAGTVITLCCIAVPTLYTVILLSICCYMYKHFIVYIIYRAVRRHNGHSLIFWPIEPVMATKPVQKYFYIFKFFGKITKSLAIKPVWNLSFLYVFSSDRSFYSDSVLVEIRSANFLRFWAFLTICIVFLFQTWMQIDND